jgi:cytochrome c
MKTRTHALIAAASLLASGAALADKAKDDAMLALATKSGCMTCHHIEPGAKGPEGLAPVGPAWKDVAAKYKGDKKAQATLTQIVLKGSNPYESHWKGKASGLAMPPNAVAIQEKDARDLVGWILGLN